MKSNHIGRAVLARVNFEPRRAVIVEHVPYGQGGSPGVLVDLAEALPGQGRRVWLISANPEHYPDDPQGAFASLQPFRCSNKGGCYYHSHTRTTALDACPQCGSPLETPLG